MVFGLPGLIPRHVDVLIRRHEERKKQRETSLKNSQTAHGGLSM